MLLEGRQGFTSVEGLLAPFLYIDPAHGSST